MTIKRAKEILGDKYAHLSDAQIQSIVTMLYNMGNRIIDQYVKNSTTRSTK